MSVKAYNQPPYFDDFDQSKGYYRILFRPGVSVQVRELTQLQTAIQAQIDRLGNHLFKDGSRVLGGLPTINNQLDYVKIESSFTYNSNTYTTDNYYDEFVGTTLTGLTTGVVAEVVDAVGPENNDPITLYVRYKSAGTNNTDQKFAAEEVFQSNGGPTRFGKVQAAAETPIGAGTRVSVDEGVYFISGSFVYIESQTAIVDKYSTTPSARIVYKVNERIVTEAEDPSLVDNANGAPNESAPGAHRYTITCDLTVQSFELVDRDEDNIIQILVLENGVTQESTRESDYGEIMKTMAQRTYEESGNYTVEPFQIGMRESGASDTFNAVLEPAVAYVKGFRVETLAPTTVEVNRAREYDVFNAAAIQAPIGNYVEVENVSGLPDVDTFNTVELRNSVANQIGTARIRSFEYLSGSIGTTSARYRVYLFDIRLNPGETFANIADLLQTNNPQFTADLILDNGFATLYGSGNNSLIFPLPFGTVRTLRSVGGQIDTLYNSKITFSGTAAGGELTLTTGTTDVLFTSTAVEDWMCVQVSDGAVLNISGNITIGGSPVGSSVTITGLPDVALKLIGPVRKNLSEKTKTLQSDVQQTITTPNTTPGSSDVLNHADIYALKAVYMSADTNTTPTTSDLDVTNRYTLDDGQRDNYYDLGRIRLRRGVTPPIGQLLVVYDHFNHGAGDYFSVDSYTNVAYGDIPDFSGARGSYNLRDVVDFRPRIGSDGSTFDSSGGSTVDMIKPNSLITADVQYYLPRRDKIYVDYRGEFGVVEGVPDLDPKYPESPADAMILYKLDIGPYTFSPSDAVPKLVDNRRYTMSDIGRIEKRVTNIEYYTSLSLLEKETADKQVFDSQGERFKNGFVVDGFFGHNVGDVENPDYRIAIDRTQGILRPHFTEDAIRLIKDASQTSSVEQHGSIITLPYTEKEYTSQPYASRTENLNPYFVFQYDGNMTISPESDEWKDTETRPEVVINETGTYDAIEFLTDSQDVVGTEWNEWEKNWTGRQIISQSDNTTSERDWFKVRTKTTRTTQALESTGESRSGLRTTLNPDTVTRSAGNRVVDINFVPYIRSRLVFFRAERLKPNTKVFLFFDGVDISAYARPETFEWFHENPTDQTYPGDTDHPRGVDPLITDGDGNIEGSFLIPSNDQIKFKTGTRAVRLIDNDSNDLELANTYAEASYSAQGLQQVNEGLKISTKVPRFEASEVSDSRVITERVTSKRVIDRDTKSCFIDPLAQTFFIDQEGGLFVTSLDVFFKTKSTDSPMIAQLRTVENGYPTTTVIPFSEKVLKPADVNTSADATVPTTVTFEAPIYLEDQTEYCFVLKALDTGYEAWVSELGGYDVTNVDQRITDQPHSGVLFKSANAQTWTAEQFKDIKFNLNRAQFDTNAVGSLVTHSADIAPKKLGVDPITVHSGYSTVRVHHKNHGLFENSQVEISGVDQSVGGIPATELNGTHVVSNVEFDSYEIDVTTNATASGRGGGSAVKATRNILANVLHPIVNQIVLPGTDASWKTRLLTGQSLANPNEQPYNFITPFEVLVNENVDLGRLHVAASPTNKSLQSDATAQPIRLSGTLTTEFDNVSPVIDLDRLSMVMVANRVDNPTDDPNESGANYIAPEPDGTARYIPETDARDNTALSRYMTRKIVLAESADDLRVIISANKPSGASIGVYYRIETDDTSFDDIEWVEASPVEAIPFSEDSSNYTEVEYQLDGIGPFQSFAVKIVLTATNTSNVPTVRDFRAIALSS